jgi:hypothetical protein
MPIGPSPLKQKMRVKESSFIRSASHKMFIRQQRCILAGKPGHECKGPVQCCHYRMHGGAGLGMKPCDSRTWPGCFAAHSEQHAIGEPEFARKYGLDLPALCRSYAKRSTDPRVRETASG